MPNSQDLIWITGASTGIGRAVAEELLRRGCKVAVTARSTDKLQAIAKSWPGQAFAYPCDVTDAEALAKTAAAIESQVGAISGVILNAGGAPTARPTLAIDTDAYRKTFALNFFGVLNGIDAVLPHFQNRGRGRIAIVASVAGYRGMPAAGAYCSSKAALISMSETLHIEMRRLNIKVQVINPGFVKTPLTDRNDFPMPFVISAEKAARIIADGLDKEKFEIVFPWRMALAMKTLRLLPYALYFRLFSRVPSQWRKRPGA